MERENYFGKNEIAYRLQLPLERIEVLMNECGMLINEEEAFVEWGLNNFDRLWEEMKLYGPIAEMEANYPAASVQPSGGSLHRQHDI